MGRSLLLWGLREITHRLDPASAPAPANVAVPPVTAVELARKILSFSPLGSSTLALDPPPEISQNLSAAAPYIDEVCGVVRAAGKKTEYLESSLERYRHYLAAILSLPREAKILEIGAAPGHLSIAMHLAGYRSTGINLNALWRDTYPSPEWFERLDVREHDAERAPLPWEDGTFHCVLLTEVLEHFAIEDPLKALKEIVRVLRPGGLMVFSTPNVCNISNIVALATGHNVFWPPELFYGSLDRHNREYTPDEVRRVLTAAGFGRLSLYGLNDHNNWRSRANEHAYAIVAALGDRHPLLRNTIGALAYK